MKRMLAFFLLTLLGQQSTVGADQPMIDLDIDVRALNGEKVINLKDVYTGKVILVVNTASKCGYTRQYEGLEEMYATYKDEGLVVLGFPSNDFYQEQGSEKEIQDFCRLTYGVKFPMFKKTSVRKPSADVLYQRLGDAAGEYPKWNFHKYLIDREGHLVGSYRSSVKAETGQLFKTIQSLL